MTLAADSSCVCETAIAANFNERRMPVDILLLHYTGMENGAKAQEWLCVPESQVSCHYLVYEDGRIVQMVAEDMRAWHAGAGTWQGRDDVNSRSIGIEIVNPGHEFGYPDFPEIQIGAVAELCGDIVARRGIAARNVLDLIAAGGNVYYLAKFAGIFGLDVQDIGAQQTGMSKDAFKAMLLNHAQ